MVLLNAEEVVFQRNEKGELIPKRVSIEGFDDKEVVLVPLLRGQIEEILGKEIPPTERDNLLILGAVKTPAFSEEQVRNLPLGIATALARTVLKHSGVNMDGGGESKKKV